MRTIIIVAIGILFIIAVHQRYYDDGRCGEAGGILVQGVYRNVCVKPIDLERN